MYICTCDNCQGTVKKLQAEIAALKVALAIHSKADVRLERIRCALKTNITLNDQVAEITRILE